MKRQTAAIAPYHPGLASVTWAIAEHLDSNRIVLAKSGSDCLYEDLWSTIIMESGELPVGETRNFNFEIKTIDNHNTKRWFHATLYRMSSGRYELTAYIL